MAADSVRVKPASYLGGIPGQKRRNSGHGTLHLGPRSLYVGKAVVLGAAVVGAKYGKVDLDKISSIGIRAMTTPERVAITVHLKDGSAGSYEVKGQSQQKVLELLQPVATQLGVRISEEAAGAGVLPDSRLRFASRQLHHPPVRLRARRNPRTGQRRSAPITAAPWPGVVVVHGFAGMSHDPRHQADWLAGEGYLAAAPDLYYWGSRLRCLWTIMRETATGHGRTFDDINSVRAGWRARTGAPA